MHLFSFQFIVYIEAWSNGISQLSLLVVCLFTFVLSFISFFLSLSFPCQENMKFESINFFELEILILTFQGLVMSVHIFNSSLIVWIQSFNIFFPYNNHHWMGILASFSFLQIGSSFVLFKWPFSFYGLQW